MAISAARRGRPVAYEMPSQPARHRRRDLVVVAGAPALMAAALSLIGITGRSLGFDEAATFAIASQHGASLWRAVAHDGGNMSSFYLLMHVLMAVLGHGLLVLRLPSALAATLTAPLVGLTANRLGDARAGLIAGLITAVSLPVVYWAQTARGYAPMLMFVCAGFWAYVELAGAADDRAGRRAAVLYLLAMALACYASFVAVLVVPVQVLAVARRPAARRRLIWALIGLAIVCIPLVILAVRRGSEQLFWVPPPSSRVDTQVLESVTSAGLEPSFHRTATTYALIVVTLGSLGLLAPLLGWRLYRGEPTWGLSLSLGWFATPVILTFVVSLFSQPMFLPRDLLVCVPAVAVALGLGLADRRVPRAAAIAAVAALIVLRGQQVLAAYDVSPEPWRAVTADVIAHSRPGDCIAFYPEDARSPFGYYVADLHGAGRAPRAILPVASWGQVRPDVERYVTLSAREVALRTAGCRRMWLVSSHEGQADGPPQSRINRTRYFALGARLARDFGFGALRTYGYASAIHVQLLPGPVRDAASSRRTSAR